MSQALLFGNDVIAVKELLNFLRRGNKAVYNKSCLPLTPDKLFCSTRVQCQLTTSVSWTREPEGVRWAGQRVWPWPSRREVPARGGGGNRDPLLLTSLSYPSQVQLHIVLARETSSLILHALRTYMYVDHTFHTVMFLLHHKFFPHFQDCFSIMKPIMFVTLR